MSKRFVQAASDIEKEYIQAFSRIATVNAYAGWIELSEIEQQVLDLFVKVKARVLDLGCGVGRIPKIIGSKLHYYLGIDGSPEMIKAANELNPDFKFLCEDILNPTFKERDFDVVLLMNNVIDMLHPIERRNELFALSKELLAHSGVLIFSSHLLKSQDTSPGYYEENYHGAMVKTYRSSFSDLCKEVEGHEFEIKMTAIDYRSRIAEWAYIVATKRELLTSVMLKSR